MKGLAAMPDKLSRRAWEQELSEVQRAVTPSEDIRSTQIIAKRASATPAPIGDLLHLAMFMLGGVVIALGFLVFSWNITHRAVLGATILMVGICFVIAAFRRKRRA